MSRLVTAVLSLAACGLVFTLCELLLPHAGIKKTAKTAIGILFLKMLADQIIGILR